MLSSKKSFYHIRSRGKHVKITMSTKIFLYLCFLFSIGQKKANQIADGGSEHSSRPKVKTGKKQLKKEVQNQSESHKKRVVKQKPLRNRIKMCFICYQK